MSGKDFEVDPRVLRSREDFGKALSILAKEHSIRTVAKLAHVPYGTIAGWFAGTAIPQTDNTDFVKVLRICGVTAKDELEAWREAAREIRSSSQATVCSEAPYRGLASFQKDDADDFYGRDDLIGELVQSVQEGLTGRTSAVIAVFGASGSGKSSLLAAGLMARMPEALRTTPTSEPDTEIAVAVSELENRASTAQVLIVDQCEELWTLQYGSDEQGLRKRQRCLQQLSDWVDQPAHVLVIGLRADYFGQAIAEPLLRGGLDDPILITPMDRRQLTEVITTPASNRSIEIEEALVGKLLDELHATDNDSDAGALPLLSHALRQTWDNYKMPKRGKRVITYSDYFRTGGIQDAVNRTAENVFDALTGDQQLAARRVMVRLVVVTEEAIARRLARREELIWQDLSPDDINWVIDRFADQRLLTLAENDVQISHEALLNAWPRMVKWIGDDRVSIIRHRRLGNLTHQWETNDRHVDYLISAGRTEEFAKWASDVDVRRQLNALEQEFLDTNIAHHEAIAAEKQQTLETLRRNGEELQQRATELQRRTDELQRSNTKLRRTQRVLTGAAVILVIAVVGLIVSVVVTKQSLDSARVARDQAASRQAAVKSQLLRDRDPALAQQLALAGYRISPTPEAKSALLDSIAVPTPQRTPTIAGPITAALTSDAALLAVGNNDGQVRIIDRSRSSIGIEKTLPISLGHLYAAAFRPESRVLAIGGGAGASLWDLTNFDNPRLVTSLPGLSSKVERLAWSPDGAELAAATDTGTFRWAIGTEGAATPADVLPTRDGTGREVGARAVAYSPDGTLLATGGDNAAVQLWSRRTGSAPMALTEKPLSKPGSYVLDLAFDSTSTKLAVGSRDNAARVFDVTNPAIPVEVRHAMGFTSYVNAVAFSPDNSTLAAGSSDDKVRLFDLDTDVDAPARQTLPGPAIVTWIRYAGNRLVTTSTDGFVREWPLPGPVSTDLHGRIFTLAPDKSSHTMLVGLVAGGADNVVRQFDISDPANIHERGLPLRINPGDELSGVVAISNDGRTAAAGTKTGSVYMWDISNPAAPRVLAPPVIAVADQHSIATAVFTPDGRYLLAASADDPTHHIAVIDRADPARPRTTDPLDGGDLVQLLSVSDDGRYLAAATAGKVRLWNISGSPNPNHLIAEVGGFASAVTAVRFGSHHLLAAGSDDKTIKLYTATDTSMMDLTRITGPSGAVVSLTFDPSSTELAAGIGDNEIWIWDVHDPRTPSTIAEVTAYADRVNDVAYGPNGESFTAAGFSRNLRTWLADPNAAAHQICIHPAAAITDDEWHRDLPGTAFRPVCPS